jgi:tetratricopeptide (TPR) repeat protein
MKRGTLIQTFSVLGVTLVFLAVYAAPKKESLKAIQNKQEAEEKSQIKTQIDEIKSKLSPGLTNQINTQEKMYSGAATNNGKIAALDSLIKLWDGAMHPQVAVIYSEEKASVSGTAEAWLNAGNRYLGLAGVSDPKDKNWDLDNAEKCYNKALELNPDLADAKINLAVSIVEKGTEPPMRGITLLKEVVEKEPRNVKALVQLGHFSVMSGQLDKAIERYNSALGVAPEATEINFFLADTYGKMGKSPEAGKYLNVYLKSVNDTALIRATKQYMKDNYNIN